LTSRTRNPNARRFRHTPPVSIPHVHHCTVPAGIGMFDHHPRFRRKQDYRQSQPREAQLAMTPDTVAPGVRTTLASGRASVARTRNAPNHATGVCRQFSCFMERWIV
jgi:hypothetical protein